MIRSRSKPTRRTKDGRLILSPADYRKMRRRLFDYQFGRCFLCAKQCRFDSRSFHAHHQGGRGLGGSKRNDVCWFDHPTPSRFANRKGLVRGFVYGLCGGPGSCHSKFSPGWGKGGKR